MFRGKKGLLLCNFSCVMKLPFLLPQMCTTFYRKWILLERFLVIFSVDRCLKDRCLKEKLLCSEMQIMPSITLYWPWWRTKDYSKKKITLKKWNLGENLFLVITKRSRCALTSLVSVWTISSQYSLLALPHPENTRKPKVAITK